MGRERERVCVCESEKEREIARERGNKEWEGKSV